MTETSVSYGTMHVPDDPRDAKIERLRAEVAAWQSWANMVIESGGVGEAEEREFERLTTGGNDSG